MWFVVIIIWLLLLLLLLLFLLFARGESFEHKSFRRCWGQILQNTLQFSLLSIPKCKPEVCVRVNMTFLFVFCCSSLSLLLTLIHKHTYTHTHTELDVLNRRLDKSLLLQIITKCADLAHPLKDTKLHLMWTQRMFEEFWLQVTAFISRTFTQVIPLTRRHHYGTRKHTYTHTHTIYTCTGWSREKIIITYIAVLWSDSEETSQDSIGIHNFLCSSANNCVL